MLQWIEKYMRSKLLWKDTKCQINKTLIRLVVLYGQDSWTVTKTDEEKRSLFKRRILRKICGPSCVIRVWKIK
jgi:hypothetical protein